MSILFKLIAKNAERIGKALKTNPSDAFVQTNVDDVIHIVKELIF